jgi:trk system potassium uptake protein TrkA
MKIVVVGAGKVGYYLAKRLYHGKHIVSIVEKDKSTCEEIAKELEVLVINGDGCDPAILEEAGVKHADVVAAVTGEDEDNIIVCQLSKELFHTRRTVGRVNNPDNERVFAELGIDVPVDATMIIGKIIEEEVSFADFVNLMSFKRGKLAIVRVDLSADSPVVNKKIKDIELPKDAVLVSIVRGEEVILPKGNTVLVAGDDIIAMAMVGNEASLINMLVGKM